jgi:hypothetical protein
VLPLRFVDGVRALLEPVENVTPAIRNPNNGDVDKIAESIAINGYRVPIIVREGTNEIICGNHRYYAVLSLGGDQIPVIRQPFTDEQAMRFLVADNRTARLGRDDPSMLLEILDELRVDTPAGLFGTGFDVEDVDRLRELIDSPFAGGDFAPQRGRNVVHTCPQCGHQWGPGLRTTPEDGTQEWPEQAWDAYDRLTGEGDS